MNDFKLQVSLTSSNAEKISRHELLEWVNTTVNGHYKKIEELCTGVAYCQLMELLFPNCIGLKRVKMNAKLEHEYLHNLKLFQGGFTKIQYDKTVPIEKLVKGRFQDNFEFLQWFKKFFDIYSPNKENKNSSAPMPLTKENHKAPTTWRTSSANIIEMAKPNFKAVDTIIKAKTTPPYKPAGQEENRESNCNNAKGNQKEAQQISPSSLRVIKEQLNSLVSQINKVEMDRNRYFNKLAAIETLVQESIENNEKVEWSKRALKILYSTEEDSPIASPGS